MEEFVGFFETPIWWMAHASCCSHRFDYYLQIYTSIGPEEIEQTTVWQRGLRVGCNFSLPQKMDEEVTIPSGGYWGPITASTEWCERNYQVTPYIAEFYNTLSNFPGIILAFIGLIYSINQKFERRFSVLHLSTIALGIGSILFPCHPPACAATKWWNTNGVGDAVTHIRSLLSWLALSQHYAHLSVSLWHHICCAPLPIPLCGWLPTTLCISSPPLPPKNV